MSNYRHKHRIVCTDIISEAREVFAFDGNRSCRNYLKDVQRMSRGSPLIDTIPLVREIFKRRIFIDVPKIRFDTVGAKRHYLTITSVWKEQIDQSGAATKMESTIHWLGSYILHMMYKKKNHFSNPH